MEAYRVEFTIIVDHPEAAAVNVFDSICRGEWDFGSEYVSKVRVIAMRESASPRVVRQWRIRDRQVKAAA